MWSSTRKSCKVPFRRVFVPICTLAVSILATGWLLGTSRSAALMSEETQALPPLSSTLVSCAALSLADMPLPDAEQNTVLDFENGMLQIEYRDLVGTERVITLDYEDDLACMRQPALAHVIDHALEAHAEVMRSRCPSLMALLTSDHRQEVRGVLVDPAALEAYVEQFCR